MAFTVDSERNGHEDGTVNENGDVWYFGRWFPPYETPYGGWNYGTNKLGPRYGQNGLPLDHDVGYFNYLTGGKFLQLGQDGKWHWVGNNPHGDPPAAKYKLVHGANGSVLVDANGNQIPYNPDPTKYNNTSDKPGFGGVNFGGGHASGGTGEGGSQGSGGHGGSGGGHGGGQGSGSGNGQDDNQGDDSDDNGQDDGSSHRTGRGSKAGKAKQGNSLASTSSMSLNINRSAGTLQTATESETTRQDRLNKLKVGDGPDIRQTNFTPGVWGGNNRIGPPGVPRPQGMDVIIPPNPHIKPGEGSNVGPPGIGGGLTGGPGTVVTFNSSHSDVKPPKGNPDPRPRGPSGYDPNQPHIPELDGGDMGTPPAGNGKPPKKHFWSGLLSDGGDGHGGAGQGDTTELPNQPWAVKPPKGIPIPKNPTGAGSLTDPLTGRRKHGDLGDLGDADMFGGFDPTKPHHGGRGPGG